MLIQEKLFKNLAEISDDRFYPPNILHEKIHERKIYEGWKRRIKEVLDNKLPDNFNLYIHVPFCQTHCSFCRFLIHVVNSPKELDDYLKVLKKEIKRLSPIFEGIEFKTVYLGGGTPTIFSASQLQNLFETLDKYFYIKKTFQRIIEATPLTLSREKLELLKKYNFNRLTIGIQTVDEKLVKKINRPGQTKEVVKDIYFKAKEIGIENINMDLLGGLPGQSIKSFRDSLEFILKLKPEALHIYSYKEEEIVPFYRQGIRVSSKEKNKRKKMFSLADKLIREAGYQSYRNEPYLLSPWAANMQWQLVQAGSSLLGIGAGAESYIPNNFYYENSPILKDYMHSKYKRGISINKRETMTNYVLNNIRTGIKRKSFFQIFHSNFDEIFSREISYLKKIGKILDDGEKVKFNAKSNYDFRVYSKIFFSQKILKKAAIKWKKLNSRKEILSNKLIGSPADF